jgi:hypothetical protein
MSLRPGSPRFWSIAFGALAVLSFGAAIPLSVLSDQVANLVIAAVIGLPSAAIGVLVTRRQPPIPSASTKAAGWRPSITRLAGSTPSRARSSS